VRVKLKIHVVLKRKDWGPKKAFFRWFNETKDKKKEEIKKQRN